MKTIAFSILFVIPFALSAQEDITPKPPLPEKQGVDSSQVYVYVDVQAEFPGGMNGYMEYVKKNLRYPASAKDKGLQGKCYLTFVIAWDGTIHNPKVVRGIPDCPDCDAEAVRLIKSMPAWKPAMSGGRIVNSQFTIPVAFKIPVEENKQ